MNELQTFRNQEFGKVRAIEKDGEPWLIGKDVAEALGYSNTSKAVINHVDEEDKRFEMLPITDSQNGNLTKTAVINESGLYSLVLSSKLPGAKKFKRWVTSEVLPSIRKHGAYMTPDTIEKALSDPDTVIRLATTLKEERARRINLEAQAERDRPKVLFAEAVETSKSSILIGELAKLLKQNGVRIGQNRLFEWLRQKGYLISRRGTDFNMPTQRSMEIGLFEIKERSITDPNGSVRITKTPKVTGKGQEYFIQKFLGDSFTDKEDLSKGRNQNAQS